MARDGGRALENTWIFAQLVLIILVRERLPAKRPGGGRVPAKTRICAQLLFASLLRERPPGQMAWVACARENLN